MFESGENDGENREYEKIQESNVLKSADRLQTLQKENDLDEIYGYSQGVRVILMLKMILFHFRK